MTSIDIAEFRTLLAQERGRIVDTIAHLHEESPRNMEDELGEGLEEGAQQTLAQIDRALARLDEGTYGSCERCGNPIGEERLRARPWATLCIDDQRRADRG